MFQLNNIKTMNIFFANLDHLIFILIGIYLLLLGYKVLDRKKGNQEEHLKMYKWHEKYDKYIRIAGIALIVIGTFQFFVPKLNSSSEWTNEQKDKMVNEILATSNFLKTINQDTATLVAKCFVEKYIERFTTEESKKHDAMLFDEVLQIKMPIFKECIKQYGVKIKE
jgi:uncharacterized membrane protein